MKDIFFILVTILTFYSCKAQSPVISLEDWDGTEQDNEYYKDVNNVLNEYEGTWLYTNGNTSLKIILVKSTQFFNGDYYEDIIVGGYQYIENGTEIVNTLSNADSTLALSSSIDGNIISNNCNYLPVDDCSDDEKHLLLSIDDPNTTGHVGDLVIFKRAVSGQEAIKINIVLTYVGEEPTDGNFPLPSIPWQMHDIVLIKQ